MLNKLKKIANAKINVNTDHNIYTMMVFNRKVEVDDGIKPRRASIKNSTTTEKKLFQLFLQFFFRGVLIHGMAKM